MDNRKDITKCELFLWANEQIRIPDEKIMGQYLKLKLKD